MLRTDHLNLRSNELEAKEKSLAVNIEKSSEIFESLWNGYQLLGILKPKHSELYTISRDDVKKELNTLEIKYNTSVEEFSKSEIKEEFIADLLTLLTSRWNTIQELKKVWKTRRIRFSTEQIELTKQLEPLDSVIEIDKINNLIIENIAEQEKLMTAEEEGTEEQFNICEMRKKILAIATEIFNEDAK